MKKISLTILAALAFVGVSSTANAATTILATDDFVGITFWVVSMGMIASTVFFFC